MNRIVKPAFLYFAVVFGVGFLLGMIRVPLLVPRLGQRYSELLEMPIMLAAMVLISRWIVRRFELYGEPKVALAVGISAAVLLLFIEFTVVLWLRGMSVAEFLAQRDPIAGIVYYVAVGIFAVLPFIVSISGWRRSNG